MQVCISLISNLRQSNECSFLYIACATFVCMYVCIWDRRGSATFSTNGVFHSQKGHLSSVQDLDHEYTQLIYVRNVRTIKVSVQSWEKNNLSRSQMRCSCILQCLALIRGRRYNFFLLNYLHGWKTSEAYQRNNTKWCNANSVILISVYVNSRL